ncbi:hypothetical protein Pfo_003074 [Paulownia fortunei]|nr:hypothetical protein Pfo_003074 [Paulownia fortunei]
MDDEIWDNFWAAAAATVERRSSERESQEAFVLDHDDILEVNQTLNWVAEFKYNDRNKHNTHCADQDVVAINFNHHYQMMAAGLLPPPPPPPPNIPLNSEEYRAYLKSRLHFECVAVALIRSRNAEVQNSTAANTSRLSSPKDAEWDSSDVQEEDASVVVPKKSSMATDMSSTTRGSPCRRSDGLDEAEGETESAQFADTGNARQMRRRLLNKESARRSRRRKREERTVFATRLNKLEEIVKRAVGFSSVANDDPSGMQESHHPTASGMQDYDLTQPPRQSTSSSK